MVHIEQYGSVKVIRYVSKGVETLQCNVSTKFMYILIMGNDIRYPDFSLNMEKSTENLTSKPEIQSLSPAGRDLERGFPDTVKSQIRCQIY